MTLPFNETKRLLIQVLKWDADDVRVRLHETLAQMGSKESEFYNGIVEHAPAMKLSSEQWFQLLSRLPTRMLRSQIEVDRILTEEQLKKLPPAQG